jgi:Tyrosine phosphatase family
VRGEQESVSHSVFSHRATLQFRPRCRIVVYPEPFARNSQLNALVGSGRLAKAVYLEPQLFDRAEYLQAALDEMRRLYATFEKYVHQALGITDEQLEQIRENLIKG